VSQAQGLFLHQVRDSGAKGLALTDGRLEFGAVGAYYDGDILYAGINQSLEGIVENGLVGDGKQMLGLRVR
jgi:hypothetical protein